MVIDDIGLQTSFDSRASKIQKSKYVQLRCLEMAPLLNKNYWNEGLLDGGYAKSALKLYFKLNSFA